MNFPFLFQHLDKVRGDFGHSDADDVLQHDDYAAVAVTLNLDEGTLYAVEWAAQDTDGGAFAEVYLIGTEVDQFLVAARDV